MGTADATSARSAEDELIKPQKPYNLKERLKDWLVLSKTEMIGVWLTPEIKKLVQQLADTKGVSLGEYMRQLIDRDLDQRTVFTDQLKQAIAA